MPWKLEMKEIKKKRKWLYRCPLCKKKQRVVARAERNGKVRTFTKEEVLLYNIRRTAQMIKQVRSNYEWT